LLGGCLSGLASGCLHFDKSYAGKLDEGIQQVFLFHDKDGAGAHMIIKTEVTSKTGKLPPQLAWVLPFPAKPTHYEEIDDQIFRELSGYVSPFFRVTWSSASPKPIEGIRVSDAKEVGHYRIHEIEILSETAGDELNRWLSENHYNPMPIEKQVQYLKKGAVFLAITATLDGKEATLKPLHITYPSSLLAYPLRFTHDNRSFGINLFVLTRQPQQAKAEAVSPYLRFVAAAGYTKIIGSHLQLSTLVDLLGMRAATLLRFEGRKLNTSGKYLKNLKKDPTFLP
jgi:hypothetical protein